MDQVWISVSFSRIILVCVIVVTDLADTIKIILQTQSVKCLSRIRKMPLRNSVATLTVLARSVCVFSQNLQANAGIKGKCNFQPRTGHEAQRGAGVEIYTFLTSALEGS
jgi:hypothetical protein